MLVELLTILTHKLLNTTESFLVVTRARSKSHTTPNTRCVTILYKYEISESSPYKHTFEHHRVFLDMTRAPSKSHTTPNTGCVKIFYKCEINEINPHKRTF